MSLAAVFRISLQNEFVELPGVIRVACVGDSLTAYSHYPTILQDSLGANYTVGDYGVAGATVLSDTVRPYINQFAFKEAKTFQPTVVVIMLGSNDAHLLNYLSIDEFVADYEQLIDNISAFASNPQVLLAKPPPIFTNDLDLSNANLIEGVIPRIEQVATKLNLPTIDVNTPLVAHPEYFVDGVHVNKEGADIIANEIYRAIVNLHR